MRAGGDARDGDAARVLRRPVGTRRRCTRASGLAGEIAGPAVIQEFGSTLPIHPGFTARVDELGNVVVRREA